MMRNIAVIALALLVAACGVRADLNTHRDDAARGDPDAVVDLDGLCDDVHGLVNVVRSGRDENIMSERDIVADNHLILVMDPGALSHPTMIAHFQVPWKFDFHVAEKDAPADLGAEEPQDRRAELVGNLQRIADEDRLANHPDDFDELASRSSKLTRTRATQIDGFDGFAHAFMGLDAGTGETIITDDSRL